jgi:hypothetical protein
VFRRHALLLSALVGPSLQAVTALKARFKNYLNGGAGTHFVDLLTQPIDSAQHTRITNSRDFRST